MSYRAPLDCILAAGAPAGIDGFYIKAYLCRRPLTGRICYKAIDFWLTVRLVNVMVVAALWRSVYASEVYLIFGLYSPLWCLGLSIIAPPSVNLHLMLSRSCLANVSGAEWGSCMRQWRG